MPTQARIPLDIGENPAAVPRRFGFGTGFVVPMLMVVIGFGAAGVMVVYTLPEDPSMTDYLWAVVVVVVLAGIVALVGRSMLFIMRASTAGTTAYLEGTSVVLEAPRRTLRYDLATAEVGFGWRPAVTNHRVQTGTRHTSGTYHGQYYTSGTTTPVYGTAQRAAGEVPVLYLRPVGEDQWHGLPLHDLAGVPLPGRQLAAVAEAILSRPAPTAQVHETVAGIRALADTPWLR
ncbi:hypothetical protein ACTOB_003550 [Actinoplanes oblitus]|uniref:DUF304 domain-containing protein n=1 Tax=Actinoplanes oblitus TaxID=3040509 RepID=A0ABY8WSW8_9ACTN|nr:hypothetical protein [Actinoplanes oblitus]WIM99882.1 hypothetical protein ACTOB_003550 [Actinoplanes oblitus]